MFKKKLEKLLLKIAYEAVCYAEVLIGSGKGKEKKEKAVRKNTALVGKKS